MDSNSHQIQSLKRALVELDWPKLVAFAQDLAGSQVAKQLIENLNDPDHWAQTPSEATLWQSWIAEIQNYLVKDRLWNALIGLEDPKTAIGFLHKSATLEIDQLGLILKWIHANQIWFEFKKDESLNPGLFQEDLVTLPDFKSIHQKLILILNEDGTLSERASPKLSELYQDVRSIKRDLSQLMDTLMKSYYQKGLLQESFTDVRDGRYVLPVKISHQSEVQGLIFESSASRQTVFIEPIEVAALNQKLRTKQNEIHQEIFRILQEVSKELIPYASDLEQSVLVLSKWDSAAARARLGQRYLGRRIQVSASKRFVLKRTAHPLLWFSLTPEQVIRNDIVFGQPTANGTAATLLLTGPNTGGKTVLLKTLGVAAAALRSGFLFPGSMDDDLEVPFFDSIFSDLGDSQSIESSLSSFSGHIVRFKTILENLDQRSLVLLDELNSATDPEEGAALGRAILETIMDRGAMIVSTTHDPKLKALSTQDPRILCASMAFDEKEKVPTYRIILGVPGRSRAIETAQRLGIPNEVIDLAKKYLSTGHSEVERLLAQLESDRSEIDFLKRESLASFEEADRLKKEWNQKVQFRLSETIEKLRLKLRKSLEQAQDQVREHLKKLEDAKSRKEVDSIRSEISSVFTEAQRSLGEALQSDAGPKNSPGTMTANQIQVGTQVKIPKWKANGTVLELYGNETYLVQMGNIKIKLALSDLESTPQKKNSSFSQPLGTLVQFVPDSKLDLRGKRYEEAMSELSAYLDQAFRSGELKQVTIVHGYGTGALREGTRAMLSKLNYIKSFHDAGVGQGGTGATMVEFDV